MSVIIKRLTHSQIQRSPEIQSWLDRFDEGRGTAIELLLRLQFVSRDTYAEWLKGAITFALNDKSAVYAVRKFKRDIECIWDEAGLCQLRPASSMGSEDLVQSVVANIKKNDNAMLFDHPAIDVLRSEKIRNVLLLDDSIGSGERVAGFLKRMTKHESFLSWWSYNRINFYIISFARIIEAEEAIYEWLPGANQKPRKHPTSTKLHFHSHFAYKQKNYRQRWGPSWRDLIALCSGQANVPANRRLGFGNTMANTVFYHSVPNNIPGILWFHSKDNEWNALFPQRSLPVWVTDLLERRISISAPNKSEVIDDIDENDVRILDLVRRGIRSETRLAWDMGLDVHLVNHLMLEMRTRGLVSLQNRMTEAGRSFLRKRAANSPPRMHDWSLYVPKSWCADREAVQPTELDRESGR